MHYTAELSLLRIQCKDAILHQSQAKLSKVYSGNAFMPPQH